MNSPIERVHIDLEGRSYNILIGSGLLDGPQTYAGLPGGSAAVIVTNETVGPLLASRLSAALQGRFRSVQIITLPDGEVYKDWPALNTIFTEMLGATCD